MTSSNTWRIAIAIFVLNTICCNAEANNPSSPMAAIVTTDPLNNLGKTGNKQQNSFFIVLKEIWKSDNRSIVSNCRVIITDFGSLYDFFMSFYVYRRFEILYFIRVFKISKTVIQDLERLYHFSIILIFKSL